MCVYDEIQQLAFDFETCKQYKIYITAYPKDCLPDIRQASPRGGSSPHEATLATDCCCLVRATMSSATRERTHGHLCEAVRFALRTSVQMMNSVEFQRNELIGSRLRLPSVAGVRNRNTVESKVNMCLEMDTTQCSAAAAESHVMSLMIVHYFTICFCLGPGKTPVAAADRGTLFCFSHIKLLKYKNEVVRSL